MTPPPGGFPIPPVSFLAFSISETPNVAPVNLAATILYSRYSTALFGVLQADCELPTLDKVFSTPGEPAIRLSLCAEDGVAPRDDPRFVFWAEVDTERSAYDDIAASSISDLSPAQLHAASRRSRIGSKDASVVEHHCVQPPTEIGVSNPLAVPKETRRMLVAATMER